MKRKKIRVTLWPRKVAELFYDLFKEFELTPFYNINFQ